VLVFELGHQGIHAQVALGPHAKLHAVFVEVPGRVGVQ